MYSLYIVYVYLCIVYVYLYIVMYIYVYLSILMYTFACCLPACLAGWLTFGHMDLPIVKFLNDFIKKIKHLELWMAQAQTGQVPSLFY